MKKFIGEWLRTFTACFAAFAIVVSANAQTAGNGASGVVITSPDSSVTVGGNNYNPTVALAATQNSAINWTNTQDVSVASTTPCSATGGQTGYAACYMGGDIVLGLASQPTGCTGGTTIWNATAGCSTVASSWIRACRSSTTVSCQTVLQLSAGGVLTVTGSSSVSTGNKSLTLGTGTLTSTRMSSTSSCTGTSPISPAVDCNVATITGASSQAVWNFHTAYSTAPACHAQDQTTATALKVISTTSSVTVTGLAAATDSVVVGCMN